MEMVTRRGGYLEDSYGVELKTVQHSIPLDILSDLLSRFIINVPESAKQNLIRICFQIELAYWYYLDFFVNYDNKLRSCSFKEFAAHVFQQLPFLQNDYSRLDDILDEWRVYKQSVPTYGAIILSEGNTHVLLVQSYWAKSSWGFPKGKVNEDEDPARCAIREVYEETGFDISSYLEVDNYLESVINDQLVRLYIISGVSRSTSFQPRTRYEIKACEWFSVVDLPNNRKDSTPKVKMGVNASAFFMVLPFVKRIKLISSGGKIKRQRLKSSSLSEGESTIKPKYDYRVNQTDSLKVETQRMRDSAKKKGYNCTPGNVEFFNNNRKTNERRRSSNSKRQLFNNAPQSPMFYAPSWLNFKFDKVAIMDCIP